MDASRWSQSAYPTYSVEMQQRCVCTLAGEQTGRAGIAGLLEWPICKP